MADNLSDDAIKRAVLAARKPSNLVTEADVEQPSIAETLYDISAAIPSAVSRYVSSVPERFSAATERVKQMSPSEIASTIGSTAKSMIVDPAVQAFTAPGRAYRGEISQEQMLPEALNFTGMTTLGGIPASALERSGGMMLGTSGTRMLPEAAAVELAKRELSPVGFYSHGAEAAKSIPQAKGAAEQMVGMLRKQPGVSENELINAGILTPEGQLHPDFASRGIISREDLSSHLQSRMPQVEETVLGYISDHKQSEMAIDNWLKENHYKRLDDAADELGVDERSLRRQILEDENNFKNIKSSKYESYTLPGGENYREVLLRLPNKDKTFDAASLGASDDINNYLPGGASKVNQFTFRSPHWDDPNVLAHIRMADRTGPNGEKILHVEEVQSDWGQKGKKEGFSVSDQEKEKLIDDARDARDKIEEYYNSLPERHRPTDFEIQHDISRMAQGNYPLYISSEGQAKPLIDRFINSYAMADKANKALPNAPYVTSTQGWTDLALKRILKEAAEGGYDKVVWTPGAEQASRYDLSKHIDRLNYEPWQQDGENLYAIEAFDPKGKKVYDHDALNEKELENYFGKEIAEKIITDQGQYMKERPLRDWRSFSGVDLQTGGEGMKEYYDKILPNRLQSVAKKHDKNAKVKYTDVMLPPSGKRGTNNPPIQAPGLDITPQMRESILKGQGAFQRGGRTMGNNAIDNAIRVARLSDDKIDMPKSLKELQNWKKTHPSKGSMDKAFSARASGFEGAPSVAMPANIDELLAYLRGQRASGGRAHFDDGGDANPREGDTPGYSRADYGLGSASAISNETPSFRDVEDQSMREYERAIGSGWSPTDGGGREIKNADRDISYDRGAEALNAQRASQDINPYSFGRTGVTYDARTSNPPSDIREYTRQRLATTPDDLYQAASNPSLYYGMGYPSTVGIQPTRAGAAGLLGTLYGESEYDPTAINTESGAVGMAQYLGSRKEDFLRAMGIDTRRPTDAELKDKLADTQTRQMGYIINEMLKEPSYELSEKQYLTGTNPEKVAGVITKNFERPSEQEIIDSAARRAAEALSIYSGEPPTLADTFTGSPAGKTTGRSGFNAPTEDTIDQAKAAARESSVLDKLFGTNEDRIAELERLGNRYVGGDRDAVASALSVDPNQLKSRIVMDRGQQAVDYYTKDLSDVLKEATSDLFGRTTSSYSGPKGSNMDVVNENIANRAAQERSSYGPYGDMTREEYRQMYGGKDDTAINAALQAAQTQTTKPVSYPYMTELSKSNLALPSTDGLTAQQWADTYAGGDLSKVHARVVFPKGAPRLEYYTV